MAEDEASRIRRDREIRHRIYDGKGFPFGEKRINPKKIRGAREFDLSLQRKGAFTLDQLAHSDMLHHEEAVLSGRQFPVVKSQQETTPPSPRTASSPVSAPPPQVKSNTRETSCSVCGQSVGVGSGIIERTPDGYQTRHKEH